MYRFHKKENDKKGVVGVYYTRREVNVLFVREDNVKGKNSLVFKGRIKNKDRVEIVDEDDFKKI